MPRFVPSGACLASFARLAAGLGRGKQASNRNAAAAKIGAGRQQGRLAPRHCIETLEERAMLSSYYVSTTGSDSNAGSLAKPFKTINHAAQLAVGGDTVFIEGGTYRETVTPKNSGTSGKPITFTNYNNQSVTVDGADLVTGWSDYSGKIYDANMGWTMGTGNDAVFVDGVKMNWAQWPNTSVGAAKPARASGSGGNVGGTTGTISASSIPSGLTGDMIDVLAANQWVAQTGTVTASSAGKVSYKLSSTTPSQSGAAPAPQFYVTNSFKLLDTAGEWYRDPNTGKLYLWTPTGASPSTMTVEAQHRQYAFDLSAKSYINITGLNIFAATIRTLGSSNHDIINKVHVKYPSTYTTVGSDVWGTGTSTTGLLIGGSYNTVENSEVAGSSGNGITVTGSYVTVTNDLVHDVDQAGVDDAGIWVNGSHETITHNTVYNSGRDLIKLNNGAPYSTVEYNLLHDGMLQTTDGGAIYTYGSNGEGTQIAYNTIHAMHCSGIGATGIYLDKNSTGFNIHHNLVYDTDLAMSMSTPDSNIHIYNNTLVGTKESLHNGYKASEAGDIITGNIFTNSVSISSNATQTGNLQSANPGFVNPAAGNYTLVSSSPAISKAALSPNPSLPGLTKDKGAYAYGIAAWSAGTNTGSTAIVTTGGSSAATSTTTTTGTTTAATQAATSVIQAESYAAQSGISSRGTLLGSLDTGDYLEYANVNFGTTPPKTIKLQVAVDAADAGKTIQIRTGSKTGTVIATLKVANTGGWGTYKTETATLTSTVTGTQNLFFTFAGGVAVANIDWFQFA